MKRHVFYFLRKNYLFSPIQPINIEKDTYHQGKNNDFQKREGGKFFRKIFTPAGEFVKVIK